MKTISKTLLICSAAALAVAAPANAKVSTGDMAPDVQAVDSNGDVRSLSELKGETVVLEWTNHKCPYVKKHYNKAYMDGGNMQSLQKAAAADDIVWLSIISSAPGKQGYVSGEEANKLTEKRGAAPAAVILDPAGTAGRTFSAKATPHMYVIDADQTLVYQGAIDSNSSASPNSLFNATNYVTAALDAIKAGEPVASGETAAYGCAVKY